jgi:hypothetical protein
MISAVDSSVLLDVLTGDSAFADGSEAVLRRASAEGRLVVSECVVSEICPAFVGVEEVEEFLTDWQLEFVPSSRESSLEAGRHFRRYLERGGRRGRVVVDFLIGAHALLHADRLLARDRGYLRDYFAELVVVDPAADVD